MILLDTSGLLCCYHAGERQHADAVTLFNAAPARLTHGYVLAEFVVLCQTRGLNRVRVLAFAADLLDNPHVEVVWVDETLHQQKQSRSATSTNGVKRRENQTTISSWI